MSDAGHGTPARSARTDGRSGAPSTGAKLGAWLGVVVGTLYVLNPTFGWIEFLPDNLPFVGNLDEAAFTALVLWGLRRLGIDPLKLGGPEPRP